MAFSGGYIAYERLWQRVRHLIVKLDGSLDASARGWGGVINIVGTPYREGEIFPDDWL